MSDTTFRVNQAPFFSILGSLFSRDIYQYYGVTRKGLHNYLIVPRYTT